jgi:hypothetical protein
MQLGWIDFSTQHHQQLRAALDRLGDRGVLDELKLGRIRDKIADDLFPGIATPHTRSKYLFLIPWILADVARHGKYQTPKEYVQLVHRREIRMIDALVTGSEGDLDGIIGRRAGASLQQKPSATYWSALKAYGLVTKRGSLRDFAQRNFPYWQRRQYEAGFGSAPAPPPADWKRMLNVKLTPEEATRLTGYMISSTKDSLLAWLLSLPAERLAGYCNRPEATDLIGENDLPEAIRLQLRYARHYELLFRPALLLYNQELLKINDEYDQHLLDAAWEQYKNDRAHLLDATKLTAGMLDEYPVDPVTRRFILEWSELVLAGRYQSREAIKMVRLREATVKPGRARLTDKSLARRLNEGETPGITVTTEGIRQIFSYRWGNVIRHLQDLKLSADV